MHETGSGASNKEWDERNKKPLREDVFFGTRPFMSAPCCLIALCLSFLSNGSPSEPNDLSQSDEAALGASLVDDVEAPEGSRSFPAVRGALAGQGSANPDLSLILDTALSGFSVANPEQLGEHDPARSGFSLQQLEMHLSANVDPFLRFDSNLVFGADGVEIEEAFATTLALPCNLALRSGIFLTRLGRINATHPHMWHFVDQPLVLGKFYGGDGLRNLGAELSYLLPLPWYAEWVMSAQRSTGAAVARSFLGNARREEPRLADALYTVGLKQFHPLGPDWSLLWGLTGQTGPVAHQGRAVVAAADFFLRWRPTQAHGRQSVGLQGEVLYRDRRHVDAREAGGPRHITLGDWGGYLECVYNIDARVEVGARAEAVSGLAHDPLDPDWTQTRTRYSAQVTLYPTHFSRLRLQGLGGRVPGVEKPVLGAVLALEVVVGAHGSHAY